MGSSVAMVRFCMTPPEARMVNVEQGREGESHFREAVYQAKVKAAGYFRDGTPLFRSSRIAAMSSWVLSDTGSSDLSGQG